MKGEMMIANICKTALWLAAIALLLTGCNLVKHRMAEVNRKPKPTAQMQSSEMRSLQEENESLRKSQQKTLRKVEALISQLEAEKAEQRRFRDMMATNFDLLEQSVALSLSKSAGGSPVVEPTELNLPRKRPAPPVSSAAMPAQAPRALPPAAAALSSARATSTINARKTNDTVKAVSLQVERTVGTVEQRSTTFEDPDLTPPRNPRNLQGHRAAKIVYNRGFARFARGEFRQAIMIYEDFLERFPEDIYSDNAQFWIGESYFRQNRLLEAEGAYRKVLRNYEHRSTLEGFKTPDAIYRIGQTYLKRNEPRRARYYFTAAMERFPQTSVGRKAKRELATLSLKTAGTGETAATSNGS
ncbi:MAG: tetratricopeptide repeat protein [SAR324 cluster bacterium]|nr:tetratricopeptide repeat protein [SAR324 cluster bacterium]